jgi:hypothetical protein
MILPGIEKGCMKKPCGQTGEKLVVLDSEPVIKNLSNYYKSNN